MLPFLKAKKNQTGLIVEERQSSESPKEIDPSEEMMTLEECVRDFVVAYGMKDMKQMCESIKTIHDVLHMYMDEGQSEHKDLENFAAQNIKAYKSEE